MPQPILKLIAVAVSLGWLGLILELVRRGRLREDHALLWLLTGLALLAFSLFEGALRFLADLIGVVYAPSILFGIGMMFAVVILLFQGITISRLQTQNKELAQDVALLTWEVRQWQKANQADSRTHAALADGWVADAAGEAVGGGAAEAVGAAGKAVGEAGD